MLALTMTTTIDRIDIPIGFVVWWWQGQFWTVWDSHWFLSLFPYSFELALGLGRSYSFMIRSFLLSFFILYNIPHHEPKFKRQA